MTNCAENTDREIWRGPDEDRELRSLAIDALELACEASHDAYEEKAMQVGWETNPRSRKPWAEVPEENKATVRSSIKAGIETYLSALSKAAPAAGPQNPLRSDMQEVKEALGKAASRLDHAAQRLMESENVGTAIAARGWAAEARAALTRLNTAASTFTDEQTFDGAAPHNAEFNSLPKEGGCR